MVLFNRQKEAIPQNSDDSRLSSHQADQIREHLTFIIQTLIIFIKQYSMDVKEIDAHGFKKDMDDLSDYIETQKNSDKARAYFDKRKLRIDRYHVRLKKYLEEREKELWDIIELLTHAMTNFTTDNQSFYKELYEQSEKIDDLTRLDDIKKIKSALKEEVDKMQSSVSSKKELEQKQLDRLASQVDILKVQLEKVKEKSEKDGLTGVYNRQAFDSRMIDIVNRRFIKKISVALLLMDIDDFKAINDTYGHTVGDRVLVAFSKKCIDSIRQEDFLARYGGEEFALLLEGASLRNATKKAKQICKAIAAKRYAVEGDRDACLTVTVSIGISTLKKDDTVESFINRADKALYLAKQNGKNRAVNEKSVN